MKRWWGAYMTWRIEQTAIAQAALHEHVGMLAIVDVLSFSTAVDVAVSRGAIVFPFSFVEELGVRFAAERVGALLARPRRSAGAKYRLSPVSLLSIPAGTKLVLPSLNRSLTLSGHWLRVTLS